MKEKLTSFPPVLPADPKVLILGSMPGGMSLAKQEYYGNPRNHFWDILYELFNQAPLATYDEKRSFVKQHHIALWDTIGTCFREGSLDANITNEEPNDVIGLVKKHSSVRLIACNGTKSFQTFKKFFGGVKLQHVDVIKLPSTSPVPGRYTKSFAGKVEEWSRILTYL
ncbi:DNA-deoxyinosine glycosylase [Virgibacillus dakarensis]|uniref:DNA-deoxyinosine glycosylase n=1 Tax=Lentibacillus populi TaxID=1827502 RepID=UPI0012D921F2|nr:DNA-deoxyinosine glycosylase [Lentibacillus populi]MTW88318.1 DNA-deoxyinosine glycosylase [Virgibacillus dakarensis]